MSETIIPPVPSEVASYIYAGFWRRFWAVSVDFAIIVMALVFIFVPLEFALFVGQVVTWPISAAVVGVQASLLPLYGLKVQIIAWLYFALMESLGWQATVGKRLFGVRVMTEEGARLSFGRATGRYFAKYLSAAIWMLGFVMAAFTARKQALHDHIAGTVVVRE